MEEKRALLDEIEAMAVYAMSVLESSDQFNIEDKDYWFFYGLNKKLDDIVNDIKAYYDTNGDRLG